MIRIELPYPLPLWNRVLAMNPWERNKLAKLIHGSIFALSATENEPMTQTVYRLKPSWMALYSEEYYQMIRPKKSGKSRSRVAKRTKKRR